MATTSNGYKPLKTALGLALAYMAAEVVGGILSSSLALLADAGHMLSDAASLGLALLAARLARKPPDERLTFGYVRAEFLAATVNAAALLAVGLMVLLEAAKRLHLPSQVNGKLMLVVAVPGLAVNLAMVFILHRKHKANLNLRAAFLHVLADTLGSLQVIVAGVLVVAFGWTWVDAVASLVIGLLILISSWRILREVTLVLMEGAPEGLDLQRVAQLLASIRGVVGCHDFHVWTIGSQFTAASLHLEVSEDAGEDVLWQARELLEKEFGIVHSTIQVEKRTRHESGTLPTYPRGPAVTEQ